MRVNAFDLFLKQQRFDLIFKYIYIKNKFKDAKKQTLLGSILDIFHKKNTSSFDFYKDLYVEHIRVFTDNTFCEENPSDGILKNTKDKFLNSFDRLYKNMSKKGFDKRISVIPVGENGDILDGAHRLTCAAILGLDVEVKQESRAHLFNYAFFQKKGLDPYYADYAAMEYVKLNPNAYIVNLQPVIPTSFDWPVEQILEKYGFIYYKKNINVTLNGLINLKKLSYGSCWEKNCTWIGTPDNGYAGAVNCAKQSSGNNPLRAYVFVCDNLEKVLAAKKEIRALFDIGNYSVHINDTRQEAIALAQTYFNENSLHMINNRPYLYEDKHFDEMVDELKNNIANNKALSYEDFCCIATSVFGIRPSGDVDLFYIGPEKIDFYSDDLSDNSDEFKFYPLTPEQILYIPKNHCYYRGIKFAKPEILLQIKQARNKPRDPETCGMITEYLSK